MIFTNFPDKKIREPDRGLRLDHLRRVPAPDQDADRAAGVFHAGGRHCAHGRCESVGVCFGKALGWFVTASLVSLILGLIMANLLEPGKISACRCRTSARRQILRRRSSR